MPYFDHNATTPLAPAARDAWLRASDDAWQNPSSPYRSSARVRNLLDDARRRLAERLGCQPEQVSFNSGATEGVNAIFAYCSAHPEFRDRPVMLSPVEHPCVLAAATRFFPGKVRYCEIDSNGRIDPDSIAALLQREPFALVSVMAANNETGIIQPWREAGELCRQASVLFHCDAAQWAGKMPATGLGAIGFVTASAHKFGGPKGTGFLVSSKSASGFQGQTGGDQEHGLRAGTEDHPSIAALLAAFEEADNKAGQSAETANRSSWRTAFEEDLQRRVPGLRIAGHEVERLWNTVSLILPRGANDRWVRKLDRAGFQVSTGSACSSGREKPSHVLAALGFSTDEAKRAIRVSSGWGTSATDWQILADALEAVFHEIGNDDENGNGLTEVVRI